MSGIVAKIRAMLEAGIELELALSAAEKFEEDAAPHKVQQARTAPERVWVYVIAVDRQGDQLVKVGISKHPNYRLETLAKERGLNLYLAHTEGPFSRPVATLVERDAHYGLAEHRERGEWFLCGVERAVEVLRQRAAGISG